MFISIKITYLVRLTQIKRQFVGNKIWNTVIVNVKRYSGSLRRKWQYYMKKCPKFLSFSFFDIHVLVHIVANIVVRDTIMHLKTALIIPLTESSTIY